MMGKLPSMAHEVVQHGLFTLTLHREIGSGTYAKVYTCTLSSVAGVDPRTYACKRIPLNTSTDRCFLEAAVMSCINHPNLATAHDPVIIKNDVLYLVQDLALGDLSRHLRVGSLGWTAPPVEQTLQWAHELCQAVQCLHREQLVHGDIKLANVLLFPDQRVRLCDLSLVVKRWRPDPDERYQTIISTVTYRAPEVFAASAGRVFWGEPADVWSLGCTLYELTRGKVLFPHKSDHDEFTLNSMLAWAASANPAVNPWGAQTWDPTLGVFDPAQDFALPRVAPVRSSLASLDDLIGKCLVVDPTRRITASGLLRHPAFSGRFVAQYSFRFFERAALTPVERVEMNQVMLPYLGAGNRVSESLRQATADIVARCPPEVREKYGFRLICLASLRIAQKLCNVKCLGASEGCEAAEKDLCNALFFRLLEGAGRREKREVGEKREVVEKTHNSKTD